MLRIVTLPNVDECRKKNRNGLTDFLRSKEALIWKQMAHFNIAREDFDEIFNSCRIKLWVTYQSKPNEKDGYYMVMLRNYITDVLRKTKIEKQISISNEAEIGAEEEENNPIEQYAAEDRTSHLDGKVLAEKLERRLSSEAVDYLHQIYHAEFSVEKGTKRVNSKFHLRRLMKRTYRYTNKELRIIEREVRSEMAKLRANIECIDDQHRYVNRALSCAISEEI